MSALRNRRTVIVVIVIIALVAVSIGVLLRQSSLNNSTALTASGTVETTQVSIAPEVGGRVQAVNVQEGDSVKAGDVLLTLDGTILKAQQAVAAAGLNSAKAAAVTAAASLNSAQTQYDLALNASVTADKAQRTSQWVMSAPSDFSLPLWYFSQSEQMSAAQAEVDAAQQALTDAQNNLNDIQNSAAGSDFVKIENNLAQARASYDVANDLNNRVQNGKTIDDLSKRQLYLLALDMHRQQNNPNSSDRTYRLNLSNIDQDIKDASQQLFDDAKANLKSAQDAYNTALTTDAANNVEKARAQVSLAQERYNTALDYVSFLRTGSQSPAVTTAEQALDQAKAASAQAQTAVEQAQANLDLLNAQVAKLTITAPSDGVVLTRAVEPGETVNPGAEVLVLGRLTNLTMTVYVPEDRLGQVFLGQMADVKFDSFPNQTFQAKVTYISDQAEFTPRNVQTVEGRQTTVFAVKLQLPDTSGKLKPGMPGDVTFILK
ncbi:MAG: efflux RND transporter periplasmic adaptor subunit [Chloroflexi bacterium]|nr:efflux RND transporter periplasmic adaptor subunit [Chloroflexota bacterium]